MTDEDRDSDTLARQDERDIQEDAPEPYPVLLIQSICKALGEARDIRANWPGAYAEGALDAVTEHLETSRRYVTAADLLEWQEAHGPVDTNLNATAQIREMLWSCPEFGAGEQSIRRYRDLIRVYWRIGKWRSQGAVTLGKAALIGSRERDTDPQGRWWRIDLSLAYWLLATQPERWRLLHHELSHLALHITEDGEARPRIRPSDIQEFGATVSRFGVVTQAHVATVAAAVRHPSWAEHRTTYGIDERTGQGMLWAVGYQPAGDGGPAEVPAPPAATPSVTPSPPAVRQFVARALDLADHVAGLPDACDARDDWRSTLRGMAADAERAGRVTAAERRALQSIRDAVQAWSA